jgi:periplasmic protein TonB
MFEYSFVPNGKTHRPLTVVVAAFGEAILITSLALVPLFFVEELPTRGLLKALMLAPVPTAPPAPPPPMLAKVIPHAAPAPRKFNADALVSPVVVPKAVAIINEAPAIELAAMAGGVPGGIPGPALPGTGTGFFSTAIAVAPPPPPPPPKAAAAPTAAPAQITVGGDVQSGRLLQMVQPVYPGRARQGRIQGNVQLKAIISADGKIKTLKVVSGHPLLVDAALDAVRHWTYQPTLLNGSPVEVKTEILVRFELGHKAT